MIMVGFFSAIVYCYAGCASGSPDEEAINVLKCDTESGKIEIVQTIRGLQGTTYFQVDRRRNRLYTVHSCEEAGKKRSKAVAFEIGRDHLLGRKTELALLRERCMNEDFSWGRSANEYIRLYRSLLKD
jgi:6-phosphogluconolactonase (cycloisomerase 2 family)